MTGSWPLAPLRWLMLDLLRVWAGVCADIHSSSRLSPSVVLARYDKPILWRFPLSFPACRHNQTDKSFSRAWDCGTVLYWSVGILDTDSFERQSLEKGRGWIHETVLMKFFRTASFLPWNMAHFNKEKDFCFSPMQLTVTIHCNYEFTHLIVGGSKDT